MLEALRRLKIHPKLISIISSLYNSPQFYVRHDQFTSNTKSQNAGIRQGCPLSPFLFVLVMSVMFRDIHRDIDLSLISSRLDGINFTEVLYADDTFLVTRDARGMNSLLHMVEKESAYYGLQLNEGKCSVISMNGNIRICFADGSVIQAAEEVTFLGGTLTKDVGISNEITN